MEYDLKGPKTPSNKALGTPKKIKGANIMGSWALGSTAPLGIVYMVCI